MILNSLESTERFEDDFYKMLLKVGVNLEYYDHVICPTKNFIKFFKNKPFKFWTSGLTVTLNNGTKRTILFIWEKHYDLPSASLKMKKILMNLRECDLEEMNRHSLKQSLKRIRKTNMNLN